MRCVPPSAGTVAVERLNETAHLDAMAGAVVLVEVEDPQAPASRQASKSAKDAADEQCTVQTPYPNG